MTDILIHRSAPSSNYTVLRNEIFDAGLGMEALGLLTYLISRPANWTVSQMQLRKMFGVGRDKLLKILKELEGSGYIVREQQRNAETKSFEKTRFCVYDQPVRADDGKEYAEEECVENASLEPRPEMPDTANPEPEKPESANPHLTSNKYIKNNNYINTQTHELPSFEALMALNPHDRLRRMKQHGLSPSSFGKTPRQMGINPRALAKAGKPVEPERRQVFVIKDTPQWDAWAATRARSWPTSDQRNPETSRFETGWWFPSEWPPGSERAEAS